MKVDVIEVLVITDGPLAVIPEEATYQVILVCMIEGEEHELVYCNELTEVQAIYLKNKLKNEVVIDPIYWT